jgi:Family of unknown function (DUF5681)
VWQKGQSGNPKGRQPGSACTVGSARFKLNAAAPESIDKIIEQAKGGDSVAAKLCLDRILPARRRSPVLANPVVEERLETGADLDDIAASVMRVMLRGELDPDDAADILSMLESRKRLAARAERPEAALQGDPAAVSLLPE